MTQEIIIKHFDKCIANAKAKGNEASATHSKWHKMECLKNPKQWSFVQRNAIDCVTTHLINRMYGNEWNGSEEQANEVFNNIIDLYIIEDTEDNWKAFQLAAQGKLKAAIAKEIDFENVF